MNERQTQTRIRKLCQYWLAPVVVLALVLGLGQGLAHAAAGDLDTTFDGDGRVTTDYLGNRNWAEAVAIQPDGKVVAVGGYEGSNGDDFFLARYNPDGSLDTSFDGNGIQLINFALNDCAFAVAIQPDGKIVVAGSTGAGHYSYDTDFAVARLNTNGSLDTSFGSGGKVVTSFSTLEDVAEAVAIQSNGKIVVAGFADSINNAENFALARYNTNGTLDTTFNTYGMITTDFFGDYDKAHGVALQSNGKIVAAGYASNVGVGEYDFALARYNTNGSLDTTFSSDGKVTTFFGSISGAQGIAIQADGKIVAAGNTVSGGSADDFALARYNTNGSLDTTFSGDGKVTTDFSGSYDGAFGLAIQADGRIVAAGTSFSDKNTGMNFALARYTTTGVLDTSFGFGGRRTTDFGSYEEARGVAMQTDGKIVVAGHIYLSGNQEQEVALARYLAGGLSEPEFGSEK